jgi:hypothetical protein
MWNHFDYGSKQKSRKHHEEEAGQRSRYSDDATGWSSDSRQAQKMCLPSVQNGSDDHTQYIQWVPGAHFQRIKRPGSDAYYSNLPSDKVKNEWRYTSTPLYGFIACTGTTSPFTSLRPKPISECISSVTRQNICRSEKRNHSKVVETFHTRNIFPEVLRFSKKL